MSIVVMADFHLGEESSVANPDLGKVLESLQREIDGFDTVLRNELQRAQDSQIVAPDNRTPELINEALKLINQDSPITHLILLGDILDLSVASYRDAAYQTRELFSRILDGVTPERIIFIPGNHDHHIWSQVSEEQWIESPLENDSLWDKPFPRRTAPHDSLRSDQPGVQFVKGFFPTACQDFVEVAYPSYTLTGPDDTPYVFDHGHLFDYPQAWIGQWGPGKMVDVKAKIEDLERANAPWLEMVWYGFGQGGPVALHAENLHDEVKILIQKAQKALKILSRARKSVGILRSLGRSVWSLIRPGSTQKKIEAAEKLLMTGKHLWGGIKKSQSRDVLTPEEGSETSTQGELERGDNLKIYLDKFANENNGYPQSATFVYGHTHRWCDYAKFHGRRVLNVGGWLADKDYPKDPSDRQTCLLVIDQNGPRLESVPINRDVWEFCNGMWASVRKAIKSIADII